MIGLKTFNNDFELGQNPSFKRLEICQDFWTFLGCEGEYSCPSATVIHKADKILPPS
jgi:hypothetical protein